MVMLVIWDAMVHIMVTVMQLNDWKCDVNIGLLGPSCMWERGVGVCGVCVGVGWGVDNIHLMYAEYQKFKILRA